MRTGRRDFLKQGTAAVGASALGLTGRYARPAGA